PEYVEQRAHAHFTADRRDDLHRRMMIRREHEPDAGFLDRLRDACGRQIDRGAERFEHVGAAGARRHAAVAVLGYARAGRGDDEHRGGRDVEGVGTVAAGADDVDEMPVRCGGRGVTAWTLTRIWHACDHLAQ